jgi:NADH dehydrogenase
MQVLVAGGAGFVGRPLCRELDERGHEVTAASRSPDVPGLPSSVSRVELDVTDSDLTDALAGHDAVVNLVALPSHRQPRGRSHEAVHRDGTRHLVAAAERVGVERFVQMSGLGVDEGVDTAYFRAKRGAEAVVRDSAVPHVIYRPSVIFGDGCQFVPFVRRITPPVATALPGGGRMRLQPIWVGDLAPVLADGVTDERHVGGCYELGGPERLTFAETVRTICGPRRVVPVPMSVARLGFAVCERVPGVPFGRDQYRVFGLDNTVADNDVERFGVTEADLATLSASVEGALDATGR